MKKSEDPANGKDKKFSLKQKIYIYFYKTKQFIYKYWIKLFQFISYFVDSFIFYVLSFLICLFVIHKVIICLNIILKPEQLESLGTAIASIIGASVAIIFSFSTFILQSTADLFSTRYLNKYIQDTKEKLFFWILVLLTISSFLTPLFVKKNTIELLITILFLAFLLIFSLYKELRNRINPETTLGKIKDDAISRLKKTNKELIKHANIQNKIFNYDENNKSLSVAIQYKSNSNWNVLILENVKYLYEIGLRLLSKNEINSFNLTLVYINDIYLQHLSLRNGHIIRVPASFWGSYTFEDEGFTTKILEYLESISNRLIQDKKKENIYFMLGIYENLVSNIQNFTYADKGFGSQKENPILNLVIAYYIGLIDKLTQSGEVDWVWESIKSISKVSNILILKEYNYFNYSQISQVIDRLMVACATGKPQETFMKEIVKIYFNLIKTSWNRYSDNEIFWKDLFKSLKKSTVLLSVSGGVNLSISELYIDFQAWMVNVVNTINSLKDEKDIKSFSEMYIKLLKRWTDYLLDFARDFGLENKNIGLPIIQSVENNIRIIHGIKLKNFHGLGDLYKAQFQVFSWYFKNVDKVDSSLLFNLEQIQETLLVEIDYNISEKRFDNKNIIKLYIQLVKDHFERLSIGYGYDHPRVIKKLIYLGLILTKYNLDTNDVINLIDELNRKYLVLNKEYFDMKAKEPNLMGPDEYQLCKEIHDIENDILSYRGNVVMGIKEFLKTQITKDVWNRFIKHIKHCENVEYKTVSRF